MTYTATRPSLTRRTTPPVILYARILGWLQVSAAAGLAACAGWLWAVSAHADSVARARGNANSWDGLGEIIGAFVLAMGLAAVLALAIPLARLRFARRAPRAVLICVESLLAGLLLVLVSGTGFFSVLVWLSCASCASCVAVVILLISQPARDWSAGRVPAGSLR